MIVTFEPCATVNRNTAHSAAHCKKSTRPTRFVPEAQFHQHEHTRSDIKIHRAKFPSALPALVVFVRGFFAASNAEQCEPLSIGSLMPHHGSRLGQGKHRRSRKQSLYAERGRSALKRESEQKMALASQRAESSVCGRSIVFLCFFFSTESSALCYCFFSALGRRDRISETHSRNCKHVRLERPVGSKCGSRCMAPSLLFSSSSRSVTCDDAKTSVEKLVLDCVHDCYNAV